MADGVRYQAARAVAQVIDRLPLNQVASDAAGGRLVYRKRRRWYAPALIAAARLAGGRFEVLSGADWHVWERAVYRQIYGEEVVVSPDGSLAVPARPGVVLAELIAREAGGRAAPEACAAALQALAELHRRTIDLPGGARPFSHGDATVANVTYDAASGRAWWFDFETAAAPRHAPSWRQADDLRALLCSATALLGPAEGVALALLAARLYRGTAVLPELLSQLAHVQRFPDPLHLAQTRITAHDTQALVEALRMSSTKG